MIDGNKSRAIKEAKWVGGSTVLLSSRILMCDAFVWQDRVKVIVKENRYREIIQKAIL